MKILITTCLSVLIGAAACTDCDEIKKDAADLLADYQKCEPGDSCVAVSMFQLAGANNCLGPFQCPKAFNSTSDLQAFSKAAKELAGDFESCGECVQAGCQGEGEFTAVCDGVAGVCELVPVDSIR